VSSAAVQGIATASVTVNSSVYVTLLGGPDVDVVIPPSGRLIVILTAEASCTANGTAFMSVSLDGSVALDANSLRVTGSDPVRASITVLITGLTPGLTVNFAAAYKRIGGGGATATFNARQIIVIPN
jgi:hypothetical protein